MGVGVSRVDRAEETGVARVSIDAVGVTGCSDSMSDMMIERYIGKLFPMQIANE